MVQPLPDTCEIDGVSFIRTKHNKHTSKQTSITLHYIASKHVTVHPCTHSCNAFAIPSLYLLHALHGKGEVVWHGAAYRCKILL